MWATLVSCEDEVMDDLYDDEGVSSQYRMRVEKEVDFVEDSASKIYITLVDGR